MTKERHPLDLLSLIFGVLFVALSIPVLVTDTPWDFDAGWVIPAVIVAVGLIIGASAFRNREESLGADQDDPAVIAAMDELPDSPNL